MNSRIYSKIVLFISLILFSFNVLTTVLELGIVPHEEDNGVFFSGKTNLPDGTRLSISVVRGSFRDTDNSIIVDNGSFKTKLFRRQGRQMVGVFDVILESMFDSTWQRESLIIELEKFSSRLISNNRLSAKTTITINDQRLQKSTSEERLIQPKNSEKTYSGDLVSMNFDNIEVRAVLAIFADYTGINMAVDDRVQGTISISVENEPWDKVLEEILERRGLSYEFTDNNSIYIAPSWVFD